MPALPPRRPARPSEPDLLAPLAGLPGVAEAVDRARVACEELRWHEAFRRRWREVRAEADVRAARGSAAVDGARVPLEAVRGLAVGGPVDAAGREVASGASDDPRGDRAGALADLPADLRLAAGALRATTLAATWRSDLGASAERPLPPFAELLARLHTAATAGWLPSQEVGRVRTAAPRDLRGLGPAPDGAEVAGRLALLGRAVASSSAPALVVAAVVHAELLTVRPFAAGNGLVARAVFRLLLAARGLDPTGAVVPEAGWAAAPNPYLAAAARFATGTPEGVAGWVAACADAVVAGADEGRRVADAVLAGRLGDAATG